MGFDLAHAVVTVFLIYGCMLVGKRLGWEGVNWRTILLIFVVVFVVNLIWPY